MSRARCVALVTALAFAAMPARVALASSEPSAPVDEPLPFDAPTPIDEPTPVEDEAAASDEVRMRDGGFVLGTLVEVVDGSHVVIDVVGTGERRTIAWSDVAEVKRAGSTPTTSLPPVEVAPPPPDPLRPQPGAPRLHIELTRPVGLHLFRVEPDGDLELACEAPCDAVIDGRDGAEFFVGSKDINPSRRFKLLDKDGEVTASVRPGKRAYTVIGALLGGTSFVFVMGGAFALADGVKHDRRPELGFGIGALSAFAVLATTSLVLLIVGRTKLRWRAGR